VKETGMQEPVGVQAKVYPLKGREVMGRCQVEHAHTVSVGLKEAMVFVDVEDMGRAERLDEEGDHEPVVHYARTGVHCTDARGTTAEESA
jgi:hypothetical protein